MLDMKSNYFILRYILYYQAKKLISINIPKTLDLNTCINFYVLKIDSVFYTTLSYIKYTFTI